MKHFLKLGDVSAQEMQDIFELADQLKYEKKHGIAHPRLAGKTLGMIFQKSSTRTRVSFETGMYQLGGSALHLSSPRFADWPGRAGAGYRARAFALSGRHHDPHLRAKRGGGSGGIRLHSRGQRADGLRPSLPGPWPIL